MNPLSALRVLVVDDDQDVRRGMGLLASGTGARARTASSAEEALALMEREADHLLISDIRMGGMSGEGLLREVARRWPASAVVLVTGYGSIRQAVDCLQQGAAHFLTKPFDNDEFIRTVERLGRRLLAKQGAPPDGERVLIARDPAMRRLLASADEVAGTTASVLIEGASGTGKELLARRIHARSAVSTRPFVAVNCAALPESLLESEFFGHRRGAFTGATEDRAGLFQRAAGGTVFLDEIASMPATAQGRLLRVLQERRLRPVGADVDVPVDFRLLAATHTDLRARVAEGRFREDLYYRLRVVSLRLPPLRERPLDIPALAMHFLRQAAALYLGPGEPPPRLAPQTLEELGAHDWPGNVRELENAVQRALIGCRGGVIFPHHLELLDRARTGAAPATDGSGSYEQAKQRAIERFQRRFLMRALERNDGNITRAAQECGMTRAALQRILKRLEIGAV